MNKQYLKISEISILLRISRQAICKWITSGKLPAKKAGRVYRIDKEDLENFLKIKK